MILLRIRAYHFGSRLCSDGWLGSWTLCGPSFRRDFNVALSPTLRVVAYAVVGEERRYDQIRVSLWYTIDLCEDTERRLNYKGAAHEWRFRRTLMGRKEARRVVWAAREAIDQQADSDIDECLKYHSAGLSTRVMLAGKADMSTNTADILARIKNTLRLKPVR